jgi:membrane protein implicated in regulation of membrane protease activity
MSELGIPPRVVAIVAAVLAAIGIAAVIAGTFSPPELIIVVALLVVAAINWRRARQTSTRPPDQPGP